MTLGNMRELTRSTDADTPERLAEHYRKLAAEEVAMAKVALTNEARARHYAKAAEYWKLANARQLGRASGGG
jgi:hypothetical protein